MLLTFEPIYWPYWPAVCWTRDMLKDWLPVVVSAFTAVALNSPRQSAGMTHRFICELLPWLLLEKGTLYLEGVGPPARCREKLARGTGARLGDPRSFSIFRR